jgi:hypothetical protein
MLAYAIIFMLVKNPHDPYDRLIINDGKGYYAYLPALFIYQDLQFGFIEYYESKYYPSDSNPSYFKEFRFDFRGQTVNKTFAGIAVLMLPFFLIAHLIALLFGQADGYSIIYQYAIGFSAYFYLWLGLLTLKRLLGYFTESSKVISFVLIAIALGTNLVYYTVVEGTMPHVYLFFLVNLFLLLAYRAIHEQQAIHYLGAAAVFGLMLIIRPQNGFVILALPFLAGNREKLFATISFLFGKKLLWLKAFTVLLSVVMLQIVMWYAQTGYLLVYSYGDETFNFLNPQIANILLSYEKGWMVYTPLAFLAITGIIKLFRDNIFRAAFILLTFLALAYIFSCWWVWHYTSQFGQRVFIDFYGLLAILLVMGFSLFRSRVYRNSYKIALISLVLLNLFQFYQHLTWVYPAGPVTSQSYWQSFFRVRPQSAVLIPEEFVARRHSFTFPAHVSTDTSSQTGISHLKTHQLKPYKLSSLFTIKYGDLVLGNQSVIKANVAIWDCHDSTLNLQFDFFTGGKKYSEYIAGINKYLQCGKLNDVEAAVFLPLSFDRNDSVQVSLMSPAALEVRSGDYDAELVLLQPDTDLRWITTPLNSVTSETHFYCDMVACGEFFSLPQISNDLARTGKFSSKTDTAHPFGAGIIVPAKEVFQEGNRAVRIHAYLHSGGSPVTGRLVLSVLSENETVFYEALPLEFEHNEWKSFELIRELPQFPGSDQELRIYFYDPEPSTPWYIDDLHVEFLTLEDRNIPPTSVELQYKSERKALVHQADTVIMDHRRAFYGLPEILLQELTGCKNTSIIVQARVMPDVWFPSASLVVAHYSGNNIVNYLAQNFTYFLRKNQWNSISFEFPLAPCVSDTDELRIYFWNPAKNEKMNITNFSVYASGN